MHSESECKQYFILAEQYRISANSLMSIIIENDNCSSGCGDTPEQADEMLKYNHDRSDASLFIPALFLYYQAIELYLKGLLKMSNSEFEITHESHKLLELLKEHYSIDIINRFKKFYVFNITMIKEYESNNKITNTKDLYESLRYPEITKGIIDHLVLKYNGIEAIEQYEKLMIIVENIKDICLKEFKKNYL